MVTTESLEPSAPEHFFAGDVYQDVSKTSEQPREESTLAAQPEREHPRMMDLEALAQMPLESLLYYVLVGEGRKKSEPVGG